MYKTLTVMCVALLIGASNTAYADLSPGIEILSENYFVNGSVTTPNYFDSYDSPSPTPVTGFVQNPNSSFSSLAIAGQYNVQSDVQRDVGQGNVYARAAYVSTFRTDNDFIDISLGAASGVGSNYDFTLNDQTLGTQLFQEIGGGLSSINDTFRFAIDPTHEYSIIMNAFSDISTGTQSMASVMADVHVVPIPGSVSLALSGLCIFGAMKRWVL